MSNEYSLSPQAIATILAGLRLFQRHRNDAEAIDHLHETSPLSNKEIDALCEKINIRGLISPSYSDVAAARLSEESRQRREQQLRKLPEVAYAVLPENGRLVRIRRGVPGYHDAAIYPPPPADEINATLGVTPAQARAMLNGAVFGWDDPSADPDHPDHTG